MMLLHFTFIACFSFLVSAYNPFQRSSQSTSTITDSPSASGSLDFKANELLESTARKPDIYTKAMIELKRLEEEPICHRVAVKLLVNNCQGLEDFREGEYQPESSRLQRHHVESFAASLAICDLERGRFVIPYACNLFTSHALQRAAEQGTLQVSPEQVGECLEALGQDHSHWNTWLSYRDKALLFCRAARFDTEKDQALLYHKMLIEIMATFSHNLDEDMKKVQAKMVEHSQAAETYFMQLKDQATSVVVNARDSLHALAKDFKEAAFIVKSSLSAAADLERAVQNLKIMLYQGTAEMAAEQERSLAITTNHTKSELGELSLSILETGETIARLQDSINMLFPAINSLSERQDILDQRSQKMDEALQNMTTSILDHKDMLEEASSTASDIHGNLQKAAAQSWNKTSNIYGDWVLRIGSPVFCVMLGGHGLAPSLARNLALLVSGYGFAETLIWLRPWECSSWWPSQPASSGATSMTQLPKSQLDFTTAESDAGNYEVHVDMV